MCIRDLKCHCIAKIQPTMCYQIGRIVLMKLELYHCIVYMVSTQRRKVTFMIFSFRNITPLTLLGHHNRSAQDRMHFLLFELGDEIDGAPTSRISNFCNRQDMIILFQYSLGKLDNHSY